MSRTGTFSSGNTCEAFVSARVHTEHIIASLGLSLSHLCILYHHLHLHEADAQQPEQLWRLSLPGNHTQGSVLLVQRRWFAIMSSYIPIKGWEIPSKTRMVILPQAKGPPLSRVARSGYFPWTFSQHSTINSSWVLLSGLASWISSAGHS